MATIRFKITHEAHILFTLDGAASEREKPSSVGKVQPLGQIWPGPVLVNKLSL